MAVGIRQYLNTAGIGNERIGWSQDKGVLVDNKAIVSPDQYTNTEGTTFADPNTIRQGLGMQGLLPTNQVKVRDYLVGQGLDNSKIGYEAFGNNAGAVLYDGNPLLQTGQFNLRDGSSYADRDLLNKQIQEAGIISPQLQRSQNIDKERMALEDLRKLYSGEYDLKSHPVYSQLEELYGMQADSAMSAEGDRLAGRGFGVEGSQFAERVAEIRGNANINLLKDVYGIREQEILGLYDLYDREGDEAYNIVNQEINNKYKAKEDAIRTWELLGYANEEVANKLGVEPNSLYSTAGGREALAVAEEETEKQRVYANGIIEQARQGRLGQEVYAGALVQQAKEGRAGQEAYAGALRYQADKGVEQESIKATGKDDNILGNIIDEGKKFYEQTVPNDTRKETEEAVWYDANRRAFSDETQRALWVEGQLNELYKEYGKSKLGL